MKKKHTVTKLKSSYKVAIVASKFNEFITRNLYDACVMELLKSGLKENQLETFWVPGSFEIPVVALRCAKKKNIQAVICLGAVIRGETAHYNLVAQEAARGIAQVSLLSGKPVIFGVLATDTVDQAQKRAQVSGNNKGRDAAQAALEMINVLSKV